MRYSVIEAHNELVRDLTKALKKALPQIADRYDREDAERLIADAEDWGELDEDELDDD